jgi:4-amino-4-deoxy-L-arabinose transferase-like glycosyltransferase
MRTALAKKVIFILSLAFLLRCYFIFIYPQFPIVSDAGQYDSLGWNLARGNGFVDTIGKAELSKPPGYPFFLAAIYRVFGHSYNHVRFFQLLFSIFTLLLAFLIAKYIFGEGTALLSLLIASFYPPFLSYNGILYAETLFTFFILLFIYLFIHEIKQKKWQIPVILGVISGYAVLLREEFIFILFGYLFLAIAHSRENLKKIILIILIAMLVIVPWTIRNYKVTGRFALVSSQSGIVLWLSSYKGEWLEWHGEDPYYIGLIRGLNESQTNQLLFKEGVKNMIESPLQYIKFSFKRLGRFWIAGHSNTFYGLKGSFKNYFAVKAYGKVLIKVSFLIFNTSLVALGAYGILQALRKLRHKTTELLFMALPVFVIMMVHFFLFSADRYQVPIMPLIIIFAAFGLFSLQNKRNIEFGKK